VQICRYLPKFGLLAVGMTRKKLTRVTMISGENSARICWENSGTCRRSCDAGKYSSDNQIAVDILTCLPNGNDPYVMGLDKVENEKIPSFASLRE
jgi:hypothetical protein